MAASRSAAVLGVSRIRLRSSLFLDLAKTTVSGALEAGQATMLRSLGGDEYDGLRFLTQASDADMAALLKMARRIGERQRERLGSTGYNILMATGASAQQSVFHTHLHVVPRFEGDGLDLWTRGGSPSGEAQAEARRLLTAPTT